MAFQRNGGSVIGSKVWDRSMGSMEVALDVESIRAECALARSVFYLRVFSSTRHYKLKDSQFPTAELMLNWELKIIYCLAIFYAPNNLNLYEMN